VLPAPLISAAPTRPLAFTPAPSRCHRAPASVMPHLLAAAPRRARAISPARPRPPRSHPDPSLSAPLLPPRDTKPDPPAFFLPVAPPNRHKKAWPDAVPHFTIFPLASTSAPRLLPHFFPRDAPSTDGDREAPNNASFHLNCAAARLRR
jgi:hypothetical protein